MMKRRIMERISAFVLLSLIPFVLRVAGELKISHTQIRKSPGRNFVVICNDTDGRQITWTGPKGTYSSSTKPDVQVTQSGTSLNFIPLAKNDGGTYTCKAGEDSKTFRLILDNPITFVDTPSIVKAKEHERVFIKCEAKADKPPIMNWIPYNPKKHQKLGDGFVINKATREDSGNYTCQANLPSTGDVAIRKITLIVYYKPSPKNPDTWTDREIVYGFIGGTVDLICDVDGLPLPLFEWHKKEDRVNREHLISNKSTVTITIDDETAFGTYSCKAKNDLGTLVKHFILKEGMQPPPPVGIQGIAENGEVLVLGIRGPNISEREDIPTLMVPTGYRIEYRPILEKEQDEKNEAEEVPWDYVDHPLAEDGKYPLYNLTDNTKYEVRVATINKAGLSEYSNSTIVKTMARSGQPSEAIFCSNVLLLFTLMLSMSWLFDH